jgi:hypothetical protein
MDREHAGGGTGSAHAGLDGSGRVCLGVGPVRLKFSVTETAALRDRLTDLLEGRGEPCGCESAPEPERKARTGADDGFGFSPSRHRSVPLGLTWE